MCFAPQRCALFRHLNFQKWSAPLVFCPFWLGNVLRATTACTFSCLIWPAGSAPAALASLLFDPPEPQIIGKNTVFRDFSYLFAHLYLLSSYSFSSDSSHLCFSTVHIVGSFTSKLPPITMYSIGMGMARLIMCSVHMIMSSYVECQPQIKKPWFINEEGIPQIVIIW